VFEVLAAHFEGGLYKTITAVFLKGFKGVLNGFKRYPLYWLISFLGKLRPPDFSSGRHPSFYPFQPGHATNQTRAGIRFFE